MKRLLLLILFIAGAFFLIQIYTGSSPKDEKAIDLFNRDTDSLLSAEQFLTIAHRGASGYAPEHTIEAYKMGEELEADYIEIDLQMTKDGRLVAMHDMELSRTTGEDGMIKDFSLNEIKELDVGSWFNEENPELAEPVFAELDIPALEEIFAVFGHEANYYIETKNPKHYPEMAEELARVLAAYNLLGEAVHEGQVIVQSFSEESLREIHALEPSIPLIQLLSYDKEAVLSKRRINTIKEYAVGLGVNYQSITKDFVERVRAADLLIHAFTVNEKTEIEKLKAYGVTGIFTDYPDL